MIEGYEQTTRVTNNFEKAWDYPSVLLANSLDAKKKGQSGVVLDILVDEALLWPLVFPGLFQSQHVSIPDSNILDLNVTIVHHNQVNFILQVQDLCVSLLALFIVKRAHWLPVQQLLVAAKRKVIIDVAPWPCIPEVELAMVCVHTQIDLSSFIEEEKSMNLQEVVDVLSRFALPTVSAVVAFIYRDD